MAAKNKALVNPQVLAWARETAGFGPEEAAKKISVSVDKLLSSEAGSDHLTVNQLRRASRAYKRPLAVFYLSEPPREEVPLHDFRRLPGRSERTESPALRFEIRRALFRRGAALELFRESGGEPARFDATAKLSESPESVAARVRQI